MYQHYVFSVMSQLHVVVGNLTVPGTKRLYVDIAEAASRSVAFKAAKISDSVRVGKSLVGLSFCFNFNSARRHS